MYEEPIVHRFGGLPGRSGGVERKSNPEHLIKCWMLGEGDRKLVQNKARAAR